MRICRCNLVAVLLLCAGSLSGNAQQPQLTQLTVTAQDQSGAVIPEALIRAQALSTSVIATAKAGNAGSATLELIPQEYKLSISARGFVEWSAIVRVASSSNPPITATLAVSNLPMCGPCVDATPLPIEEQRASLDSSIPFQTVAHHHTLRTTQTASRSRPNYADLILLHGVILTGEGLSEGHPRIVSALAIADGHILAAGTDSEIEKLVTAETCRQDLHGAFVMPGLNDAHVHLGGAGQTKLNVDLTGSKSLDEMLTRIRDKAQQSPPGHWLTGGGWDHTLWADKTLPSRQELDQITGDHPALFERIDGHIAVANTAALKAANITGATKAPLGGAIDIDGNGEPTGILRDTAMETAEQVIPPPTHDERLQGLTLAIHDAVSHGLTSLQDYSTWEDFLVFEELEKEGRLDARISEWLPFTDPIATLKEHRAHHDVNDPMLHTGMLKGFMDGSLGSRTAALKARYADEPSNSGLPRYDQAQLNSMAVERAQAGFQLGFHAIGDKATSMALDAFSQTYDACPELQPQDKNPYKVTRCWPTVAHGARDRIEHAQVVDPADIQRFTTLGVIASMQPNHLLTDMNWAEARLGPQRAAYSYAWKALLEAGVLLAFGTDYPVEPVTPFRGLYAAVTRADEAGARTYYPQDKLTRTQALYAYTQGSAYAEFDEKIKGKLVPGYLADYVILDRNLLTIPAPEILKTRVVETVVDGRTVYKDIASAEHR